MNRQDITILRVLLHQVQDLLLFPWVMKHGLGVVGTVRRG